MSLPRVVLLCGGPSDEHDVSLASARSVIGAVGGRLHLLPLVLDRGGRLLGHDDSRRALEATPIGGDGTIALTASSGPPPRLDVEALALRPDDVVFPLLHGPFGEDGSVQGLLKLLGVAHVGSGVLASAVGMDKLTMKAVFAAHGLPQVAYGGVTAAAWCRDRDGATGSLAHLRWPRFVKPANLGSSIGIARVDDMAAFGSAVDVALSFDRRVIVEEAVQSARELEIAVLGNDDPQLSPIGEIRFDATFYDYATKYTQGRARLEIPAALPERVAETVRSVALRAFDAIDAAGLARVDLFYDEAADAVTLNEINTMPGFTATSMYPRLWEAGGVPYADLVERLVTLALERR
ncbi:MAG: D-alanine--D-alanine ligase [Trueperaceae bacterium]|nr:D-alanine--D-alanine ligase [Trueperaceae bacterium]